jgi:dihydrolipoamide dehydrogenase
MRTGVDGVFAAGDVVDTPALAHVGFAEAVVIVKTILGEPVVPVDYEKVPWVVYSHPEVAWCGLTEEQAREQGHDVEVARNEHVKRFQFIGAEHGLFKIVFDRGDRKVLGLHVVSRNAGEIVQGFSLGLRLGATVDDLAAMHHVFPTFGEGVKAAAERAVPWMADLVDSAFMD